MRPNWDLKERWRSLVRTFATLASVEVGTEIALGSMVRPFWRNGWRMAPTSDEERLAREAEPTWRNGGPFGRSRP